VVKSFRAVVDFGFAMCRITVKGIRCFLGQAEKAESARLLGRKYIVGRRRRNWNKRRIEGQARLRQALISNGEFIAHYREWRLLWKPTSAQIEDEVSYLSKLAELMAPVPACESDEGSHSGFLPGRTNAHAAARVSSEDPVSSDPDRCVSRRDTKERVTQ
jgi:hypothetical protein